MALLVGGKDENGYVLYHADPSGTYVRYEAKAIGSGSEGAQSLLQEKYSKDMSLQDSLTLAVTVLKQVRLARFLCSVPDFLFQSDFSVFWQGHHCLVASLPRASAPS